MKKVLALFLAVILLDIFTGYGNPKKEFIEENRNVGIYTSISLFGSIDVKFSQNVQKGEVVVVGNSEIIQNIVTEVKGETLFISLKKLNISKEIKKMEVYVNPYGVANLISNGSGEINVENGITLPLENIKLNGSGDVNVSVDSKNTNLKLIGSGKLEIRGLSDEVSIFLKGSGDVKAKNLTAKKVSVILEGSGNSELEGLSDEVSILLKGSGDVKAKNLTAKKVSVILEGSGNVKVCAKQEFKGNIKGSGDIKVWGNPPIFNKNIKDVKGMGTIYFK